MTNEEEFDVASDKVIGVVILCMVCFVIGFFVSIGFREKIEQNTPDEIFRNIRYLTSEEGYKHPYMKTVKSISLNRALEMYDLMGPNYKLMAGIIMESACYKQINYDEEWYRKDVENYNYSISSKDLLYFILDDMEKE